MGGISPKYYSISHYSVEKGMVNHNNGVGIYRGFNIHHIYPNAK